MKQVRPSYAMRIVAVVLLLFFVPPCAFSQADPPSVNRFEGQPVVRIEWDPNPQPIAIAELIDMAPLKKDQPYTAEKVRASIERLFAVGRYRDIQVDTTQQEGGVAVRFITQGNWFIGHVAVESSVTEPPSTGQIVNSSRLDLGVPFDEDQLPAAEDNIRKLLTDNGYFDPQIAHRLDYDGAFQQVNITFVIDTGKRAHYEQPQVTGNTTVLSAEAIDKASHWRRFLLPGYRGITQTRTRSGIDHIRLKYENANRLLATVTLDRIEPIAHSKTAVPRISVDPGPVVAINAEGAKVSRKALKQNVPVFEEHTVDADLLAEGSVNLRDYFQSRGYFDADVTFRRQDVRDGKTEITYLVTPGIRHRFAHLEIDGNKYFDAKTIKERMFLTPSSFELRQGRYSEALRHRDEQVIEDLYRSNGFRDVKVGSEVRDDYNGRKGDEAVFIKITEGAQYRVAHLLVSGVSKLNLTKTVAALSSQADQVFSEFNIAIDRETIIQEYGNNGFADATFEWDSQPGQAPHTVDLTFTIHEGEQQFVRQVVTSGLHTTQPRVVNRLLALNPGILFSPTAMAETQRKLYDLGIFSQVDMAIQNPDGEEDRRYVLYDIGEAHRYSLTTGAGLEFARIGGSNAITDLSEPGGAPGVTPRVSLGLTRPERVRYRPDDQLSEPLFHAAEAGFAQLLRASRPRTAEVRRHVLDSLRRHPRCKNVSGDSPRRIGAGGATLLESAHDFLPL